MYIAPSYSFDQIREWFIYRTRHEYLCMFVSSCDSTDTQLLEFLYNNKKRIDRATGGNMAFLYLIDQSFPHHTKAKIYTLEEFRRIESELPPYNNIWHPKFETILDINIDVADEICKRYGLLRSELPALFIFSREYGFLRILHLNNKEEINIFIDSLSYVISFLEDYQNIAKEVSEFKREKSREDKEEKLTDLIKPSELIIALENAKRKEQNCINIYTQKLGNKLNVSYDIIKDILLQISVSRKINKSFLDLLTDPSLRIPRTFDSFDEQNSSPRRRHSCLFYESESDKNSKLFMGLDKNNKEKKYDVFISCKSEDYPLGNQVYEYLVENGYSVFIADRELRKLSESDYTAAIYKILDEVQQIIVVASQKDYLNSSYVYNEYHFFVVEKISGRKKGNIISIITPNLTVTDLPPELRTHQFIHFDEFEKVIDYIKKW